MSLGVTVPREVLPYLSAYTGKAVKLYVWLLEQPGQVLSLSHQPVKKIMRWGHGCTFYRILNELALGHHESDDIDAPALIQILERGRGRKATWKIRILIPRMGE